MPDARRDTLTLGHLVKRSGLARASLLHYEQLGLLLPLRRSAAGYRLYGPAEIERLLAIRRMREAGLSLDEIGQLLRGPSTASATIKSPGAAGSLHDTSRRDAAGPATLLEARLQALSEEVQRLRAQQRQLARLLAAREFRAGSSALGSKAAWVALLRRAGFDEADMRQWHAEFEAENPAAHAAFLRALRLAPAEVAAIRRAARQAASG